MPEAVSWAVAMVLLLLGLGILLALGKPPRCPSCGRRATVTEEYEVSAHPRLLAVAFRCPACGDLLARRTVGVPCE